MPTALDNGQRCPRKLLRRVVARLLNPCLSSASVPMTTASAPSTSLSSEWEAVAARPNHFLMEAGHKRSEGEGIVGSLREYEIARKPD
jgi:hypothetical protein